MLSDFAGSKIAGAEWASTTSWPAAPLVRPEDRVIEEQIGSRNLDAKLGASSGDDRRLDPVLKVERSRAWQPRRRAPGRWTGRIDYTTSYTEKSFTNADAAARV